METLEPRALFAADLAGQIDRVSLPSNVVEGQTAKGSIVVGVTNRGDTVSRSARSIVVSVVARDTDGAEVTLGSGNVRVASLAAGQRPRFVSIPLRISAGLQAGEYTVVVTVDPGNTLADDNTANNELTGPTLTIDEANADVVAGGTTVLTGEVKARSTSFATATVRNDGNVKATFVPRIEVIAKLGADERILATTDARRVSIAPGRTQKVGAVQFKLPSDWTSGDVTISVRVTPIQTLPNDDEANNIADVATVTVVNNPEPDGPLAGLGLDSTLRFRRIVDDTSGFERYEEGEFVDSQGRLGEYELTRVPGADEADFVLRYKGRVVLATVLIYRDNNESLNGKTLEFGVTRAASNGYIDLWYRDTYFAYR
jgi:hypothetical protein